MKTIRKNTAVRRKKVKTSNALEILKWRAEKDPELQKYYEEEKLNLRIALLIRDAREAAGLTQSQLADLIGTQQSVISRLEDADYEGHSLSILQKIAQALHKTLVLDFKKSRAA
ncbi:MAG: helix-turn-helix transcriptional regulator [Deltaproteobacteria bacterium]|nr:helix-turn-helix transcriptional regulator [Deltaproteobacteria bacterium]